MSINISIIIQARLGSKRLPNKMILPFFNNKSVFEILLEKLLLNFPCVPIILATSRQSENDLLVNIAKEKGINIFRGSENDVLDRFIEASKLYNVDGIIRICADNPFLDIAELRVLLETAYKNKTKDYISFKVNGKPSILSHFGFWGEYVKSSTLERVKLLTNNPLYKEHVTNYVYSNLNTFDIDLLNSTFPLDGRTDIRMTLDTMDDFQMLSSIYSEMFDKYGNDFGIKELIDFLDRNPKYKERMQFLISENIK